MKKWTTSLRRLIFLAATAAKGILKTITGNPIHITDALAKPVQALSIALEPVQDLNGYDNPWPAGGGKNLLPPDKYQNTSSVVVLGQSDVSSYGLHLKAGTYTVSIQRSEVIDSFYYQKENSAENVHIGNYNVLSATFTLESDTNIRLWAYKSAGLTAESITASQLETGSTATAYSPYSNICPISGHTDADVTRTGKNLFSSEVAHGLWTTTTFYSHEGASSKYLTSLNKIPLVGGRSYVVSFENDPNNAVASGSFVAFRGETAVNEATWFNIANGIINVPSGADSIAINLILTNNIAYISEVTTKNYQLELGSTATDYEEYRGTTYPISLGTTVYGGTLDVLTGVLTVTKAIVNLNTLTWENINLGSGITGLISESLVSVILPVANNNVIQDMECSIFKTRSTNAIYSYDYSISENMNNRIVLRNGNDTTPPDAQLCYPLATPTTIQLTAQQVELLQGENNIWSDGTMTLVYLADGNASDVEALNILLGGRYVNNHTEDEPSDREALDILLGGNR